ncbi:hypothetical protein FVR03_14245 [Pontibacter qinzhouensis]|uniref:DUF3299 domain-containing protein n=1 Tax=Pontibacter qinzhouensis TaxID=2603253 RepID=A0A5C8JNH3_9BACT|nr:hypothetical protein [Pontibacter qinzhouensis]TXK38144.1 hypothetical protein FVR03_14245 [Pontibacter qinzhouensis]
MKILFPLLFLLLLGFAPAVHAQAPTHIPLMNSTWKLVAERTYVKNANFKMVPSFPAKLKALHNKQVELPGYIIPIHAELEQDEFMLAVLPLDQCPYCGTGDIPTMIEVKMASTIRYTDKPVKIKGKLVLNETGDSRSEIFLVQAKQVK